MSEKSSFTSISLLVLAYHVGDNTAALGFKYKKKKMKRKGAQIDFLFLEQESEQENCHKGQPPAAGFMQPVFGVPIILSHMSVGVAPPPPSL